MKITSIIDNISNNKSIKSEHGLSLLIELNKKKILFDTGASDLLLDNARKLNIDLSDIDILIISHGHYDHMGGIRSFFSINNKAKVYIKRQACQKYYIKKQFFYKYVSGDLSIFEEFKDRFIYIDNNTEIIDNVYILTKISEIDNCDYIKNSMYKLNSLTLVKDPLDHELLLVIKHNNDLTVITGCSHNGIINMVNEVKLYFPNQRIKNLIGGFHLKGLTKSNEKNIINHLTTKFKKYNIEKIYTCHCTSYKYYLKLKDILNNQIEYLGISDVVISD